MGYRLGLDIGTNSIGWCLYNLDATRQPTGILDIGVRIYTDGRDPQSGTSLAADRRIARGARRNRDRGLLRKKDLMAALVRLKLMPAGKLERKALERLDPYTLRARGLDESLFAHELGRAIFHLAQRRGFKSNRITEGDADDDSGKVKPGIARLSSLMTESGARTLGEYLHFRLREKAGVRARLTGTGAKAEYDIYPQRAMLEAEFDALWTAQTKANDALSNNMREDLRAIIFRQRPLKPQVPGKCVLDPATDADDIGGLRAPWALPIAQRFRILQELANLRVIAPDLRERLLTKTERDTVLAQLLAKQKPKFTALAKAIDLGSDERFNLESERRDHLKGDESAAILGSKKCMGASWRALDTGTQASIVERLLEEENEILLIDWLCTEHDLDEDTASNLAKARLPQSHCRLGRRALSRLVPIIEDQGLDYAAAAKEAGYHHSDFRPGDILDRLPYYGAALERHVSGTGDPADDEESRLGRIANPTVHIGLNQTKRLINKLIEWHGPPAEIVVEMARELKLNQEQRDAIRKTQADNTVANDFRRGKLAELGEEDNGENRMRMRLWEELNRDNPLDRRCPYTGECISIERLFSGAVEIEHILPFSRTLDNSAANRTLTMRFANRAKGNKSPFEAFGSSPEIAGRAYDWDSILARAQSLPPNKSWRFSEDAMARFEDTERDFIARQLTDTQYLSRIAREYLTHICAPDNIWVIPGRMTAMLRGWWGLNSILSDANRKDRTDHRHHAIDAAVAAATDRGLLQRIAREAARAETEDRERVVADTPLPWDDFRDELRDALQRTIVSHRADHGQQGKLHEETAYGIIKDPEAEDGYNLVYRKPFAALNKNEIARIRDVDLRVAVEAHVSVGEGKLDEKLRAFGDAHGIRRVRLLKKEQGMIHVSDTAGAAYKALSPGDNHHIDIIALPGGIWAWWAVTVFAANQTAGGPPPWKDAHPAGRRVMRLHKGDLLMLATTPRDEERIMRIQRLSPSNNTVYLVEHFEAGDFQKRHDDPGDSFRWLFFNMNKMKDCRARRVSVDEIGRVRDPGFKP